MSLIPAPSPAGLVCSAKGCRRQATQAVVWRNPTLHVEGRRKVWLACDEDVDQLTGFISLRGFLLEVIGVDQLSEADG
ncbi:MAG: hypothetical protein Q4P07_00690 [Ornithinimicrobium sp.]|uniref:hypothetical protein n=1 Tax=Ornithinimicrobium sp. TaxID=1977084 RepID=UPI0026E0C161|nr:hypothetical protein [Ornithinimicrobium sp.]MDO5738646.1 hypothetical protein [Ornithinimicrobium sp.]